MYDIKTIRGFVKGKIVELLFEMMIKDDPNRTFTIIPFGYEKTTPELAQYQALVENHNTLEVIRRSPDFILIKNDKSQVHFVEVKYRKHYGNFAKDDMLRSAKEIRQHWKDTWFFLATQDGFYFDSGESIIENNGSMKKLDESVIPAEYQKKYFDELKEFIVLNKE